MAIIIFVPFTSGTQGDLRTNANEIAGGTYNGQQIHVNYWNTANPVLPAAGDTVVLHAHGWTRDGSLADNLGQTRTMAATIQWLHNNNAHLATSVVFFACFSALPNHIAVTWKAQYGADQVVRGTEEEAQGALAQTTRTSIRSGVWDSNRLQIIQ